MKTSQQMTLNAFLQTLIEKHGADNLVQRKTKENGTSLILVYFKNKAYVRPQKSSKDMTLEELRAACNAEKHIATYNLKTKTGAFL